MSEPLSAWQENEIEIIMTCAQSAKFSDRVRARELLRTSLKMINELVELHQNIGEALGVDHGTVIAVEAPKIAKRLRMQLRDALEAVDVCATERDEAHKELLQARAERDMARAQIDQQKAIATAERRDRLASQEREHDGHTELVATRKDRDEARRREQAAVDALAARTAELEVLERETWALSVSVLGKSKAARQQAAAIQTHVASIREGAAEVKP